MPNSKRKEEKDGQTGIAVKSAKFVLSYKFMSDISRQNAHLSPVLHWLC